MSESQLKQQVREYWNEHPCGTQFTEIEWGSKEFFENVEEERYRRQPFMREAVGFEDFAGKDLLEIGCGLGTDLIQFARGGANVTGLDLSIESVALAKRRFELFETSGRFLNGDAENLPFPDNSFDVVYSFGVLHHTPRIERAFQEVHRILRPGGQIVVMLYHSRSSHLYIGYPLEIASRLKRGLGPISRSEYFRIYDGDGNPLGKAFSKKQTRDLIPGMRVESQKTFETYRPRLGTLPNKILLGLGGRFGFYLVTRATKP